MTQVPPSLGLVVPVFDEEVRFAEYGKALVEFVDSSCGPGSSLVFVDDGSTDRTASLVAELIRSAPSSLDVRLLRRPHLGKGAAVAAGLASVIAAERSELAGFCDLDLSTPLEDFLRIVETARSTPDVLAIGSRDLAGSRLVQRESVVRESLGRAYNRLLQATVTPGVVDTQCGAKAATSDVWARLLPFCSQTGFAWDAEVVAVALALGIRVQEVAIEWRHDPRTKIRVGADGLAMVAQTPRIFRSVLGARSHALASDSAPKTEHWSARAKAAFVATALKRAGAATEGVLVDVGSGDGGVTAMVGWAHDRVVAIDVDRSLVTRAHADNGLPAVQADATRWPLATGSAAVVCLLDGDPTASLEEAARVLRADGGRLILMMPARDQLVPPAGFRVLWSGRVFSWLAALAWIERRFGYRNLDRPALVLTAIERMLLGRITSPLGPSVVCVAEPHPR